MHYEYAIESSQVAADVTIRKIPMAARVRRPATIARTQAIERVDAHFAIWLDGVSAARTSPAYCTC